MGWSKCIFTFLKNYSALSYRVISVRLFLCHVDYDFIKFSLFIIYWFDINSNFSLTEMSIFQSVKSCRISLSLFITNFSDQTLLMWSIFWCDRFNFWLFCLIIWLKLIKMLCSCLVRKTSCRVNTARLSLRKVDSRDSAVSFRSTINSLRFQKLNIKVVFCVVSGIVSYRLNWTDWSKFFMQIFSIAWSLKLLNK